MPVIGVVADDLTGATTTGVLFARSKAKATIFFNVSAALRTGVATQMDAVLISSNSRAFTPNDAYNTVKDATAALKAMGVKYFSKRIDTTFRGGIGVEIDAMLDQMPQDAIAIVVPTMPQSRRILVGGYSVIDGIALVNTPVASDVRTPVKENYIPRLIASQTKRRVEAIGLDKVLAGIQSLQNAISNSLETNAKIIVIDAISNEDIEIIAHAVYELSMDVLAVDPGPFTAKLAQVRGLISEEEDKISEEPPVENKTVLISAGSASPVTKKQMDVLCRNKRVLHIPVNPESLVCTESDREKEILAAVSVAITAINQSEPPIAILFETALHGTRLDLALVDQKKGLPPGSTAEDINTGLGRIIAKILENVGSDRIAGLYCTGGDTMVAVCNSLGVEGLQAIDYIIPQTDLSRLIGNYDGLPIVCKGGLTGDEQIGERIVERLLKEASNKEF